ncbi:unnamed protein product [Mesocestoides corti]|uniref:GLE1 RNA export mediator n=1 Tax=Mesocestoides corti TaxID=53468 RepID=A0A0R3UA90_MESCO|nr:unnamed protein product [Mesocestoides corti]
MRQLLKRVSQEMRRVTSRPMPVPSTPDSNQVSLSSRQLSTKDDLDEQPSWLVEPPQMEFSLTEELISSQKADILRRIQDVETQALIFLTLPPTNEGGWEEWEIADRINEIFNRYLENAERCLEDANALVRGETRRNEKSPDRANRVSTVVLPEALQIPGFSQRDAAAINRSTSDSLFHLFSNPDLRSTTSSVKMVIGSACSQACRIITGTDPDHCLNRLKYLLAFLEGSPVRLPGGSQTGASVFSLSHEVGADFAWNCLLTSAVAQAERQFAFSLDTALPFAAVLATLLSRFPEQTPNFLACVASNCPLLTAYVDGVEDVDEGVLQKWRGVCRLFAAVLLARTPPGFAKRPALLNPRLLWITIAGIVRQPFVAQATAEVLHGLIEMGGYVLLKLYKRQARRLFKHILDTLKASKSTSQSVPELALITCVEQYLETETALDGGYGVLLDSFWN